MTKGTLTKQDLARKIAKAEKEVKAHKAAIAIHEAAIIKLNKQIVDWSTNGRKD